MTPHARPDAPTVPGRVSRSFLPLTHVITVAVWVATVFGLLEGLLLTLSRSSPQLLAPYKASAHLLWMAAAVDICVFAGSGCALWFAFRLAPEAARARSLLLTWGVFLFLGGGTVAMALRVIHPISAILLALGIAVVSCRTIAGREARLTAWLRGRLLIVPLSLALVLVGVIAWDWAVEYREYSQLPPWTASRHP